MFKYPSYLALVSVFILGINIPFYNNLVAIEKFSRAQFSSYSPGQKIPFIVCKVHSISQTGHLIVRDAVGGLGKTTINWVGGGFTKNYQIILSGTLDSNREFIVHQYEYFPFWHFKVIGSLLAFFFLVYLLIKKIHLSRKGLTLNF